MPLGPGSETSMAERIVSMHAAYRSGKVRVLGFCMGGGLALYALAQSKALAAGVIHYQSSFPDPEDLKSLSAPMLPLRHRGSGNHQN